MMSPIDEPINEVMFTNNYSSRNSGVTTASFVTDSESNEGSTAAPEVTTNPTNLNEIKTASEVEHEESVATEEYVTGLSSSSWSSSNGFIDSESSTNKGTRGVTPSHSSVQHSWGTPTPSLKPTADSTHSSTYIGESTADIVEISSTEMEINPQKSTKSVNTVNDTGGHFGATTLPLPEVTSVPHTTTVAPYGVDEVTSSTLGVAGFLVFVAVFVVVFFMRRSCKNKSLSRQSSLESKSNSDLELVDIVVDRSPSKMKHHFGRRRPSDQKNDGKSKIYREISSTILIDTDWLTFGKKIGNGQFGCVYEGKLSRGPRSSNDYGSLTHEHVAIKTIKDITLDHTSYEDFLKEGLLMRDFSHPNVLSLTGVAIADHGMPMIVLPFMANGNLKTYIMKPKVELTVRNLLDFALQVASGMNYLSQQKFVHRDLAARNCMLTDDWTVKVADFGLSRDIYVKEYYCSEDHKAKLPVKWMAIESLSKSIYTSQSDVWSFGVLLWELLTRGVTPYPDVSNWDMNKYLKSGRRLESPQHCPPEIYSLMRSCWVEKPRERPSFSDIMQCLSVIMTGQTQESRHGDASLYLNVTPNPPQRRRSSRRHRLHSK